MIPSHKYFEVTVTVKVPIFEVSVTVISNVLVVELNVIKLERAVPFLFNAKCETGQSVAPAIVAY